MIELIYSEEQAREAYESRKDQNDEAWSQIVEYDGKLFLEWQTNGGVDESLISICTLEDHIKGHYNTEVSITIKTD